LSAHGIRGELKCRVITDFPKQRFKRGNTVLLRATPFTVRSARYQGPNVLLGLTEIVDRTTAETFRGADVEVPTSDTVSLPRGQFYWHQVIGLHVIDVTTQEDLGTVADILETGANDVYLVRGARGEVLVPAIKDVVNEIDPTNGRMLVTPLPGMLPTPKDRDQAAPVPHPRRRSQAH
jgi:16S rRNA processing protein RimM